MTLKRASGLYNIYIYTYTHHIGIIVGYGIWPKLCSPLVLKEEPWRIQKASTLQTLVSEGLQL